MNKALLGIALLTACWSTASAEEKTFASPDGQVQVTINDNGGTPTYAVRYAAEEFLKPSQLGLHTNMGDYSQNLSMTDFATKKVEDHYELRNIKQSHVDYEATEAVASFTQDGKKVMDIVFRL